MENLSKEIEFIKGITQKDLRGIAKHSAEQVATYELFRDDTDNFEESEYFEIIEEMGESLRIWVATITKLMEKYPEDFMDVEVSSPDLPEPKYKIGDNVIYDNNLKVAIESILRFDNEDNEWVYSVDGKYAHTNAGEHRLKFPEKKVRTPKIPVLADIEAKERQKADKKANALEVKISMKRQELYELKQMVISNAKFKERIAEEMQSHLKEVGLAGLGSVNSPTQEMILVDLNSKISFYKNLIRGDKDDFKAIAKRIGLDFRKSKPRKKKTVDTDEGLQGLGRPKQGGNGLWDSFVHWFNN